MRSICLFLYENEKSNKEKIEDIVKKDRYK